MERKELEPTKADNIEAKLIKIMDARRKFAYLDRCSVCNEWNNHCVAMADTMTVECEKCAAKRIWKELNAPKLDVEDFARIK